MSEVGFQTDNDSPVLFFDTTLRDGEQAPGCSLTPAEKLRIALQLARMQVDVIEAGFPASSASDFQAVKQIAQRVSGPVISGLARCTDADIFTCWDTVKAAAKPRLHVFLGTSDIHLRHQMGISRETAVGMVRQKVALAASLCPSDVQFSAMDATRADLEFLAVVLRAAIDSGATTVNLSDTVGYGLPFEWRRLIDHLRAKVPELNTVALSIHCHNDLGLATANSLAAIEGGATQVEVSVNGLGERAGVAALEEVATALVTRRDVLRRSCRIVMAEIPRAVRLVSELTGVCSAQLGDDRSQSCFVTARKGTVAMKGNERVIEVLNARLSEELGAINQYVVHAEMCENWHYGKLYAVIWQRSITEMKHAERLVERILFLEGLPIVSNLSPITIGSDVPKMHKHDLDNELGAVARYNESIQVAMEARDNATKVMLEEILADEEEHVDWIEAQFEQIEQVGLQQYLAEQIE